MNKKTKKSATSISKGNSKVAVLPASSVLSMRKYTLFLGIITFILFANTINNGYNMDDDLVTQNHPLTTNGISKVKEIFTSSYYSDEMGYAYGYRPMVHLSFAIEHTFLGESAQISHLINILLYTVVCILLFKLLMSWFGAQHFNLVFLAVLVFAVHPLHAEVVASIKNRDEILALLFTLLSALSTAKYVLKNRIVSIFWASLFVVLALLSKKSVYPLFILIPVAQVLFSSSITKWKLLIVTSALTIPSAIIASDMLFERLVLIMVIPFGASLLAFEWATKYKHILWVDIKRVFLTSIKIQSVIAWIMLFASIYLDTYFFLALGVLLLIRILIQNHKWGMTQIVLQLLIIPFFIYEIHFLDLSLILSIGYVFFLHKQNEKFIHALPLIGLSVLCLIWFNDINQNIDLKFFGKITAVLLAIWLFLYRPLLAILFSVFVVIVAILFFESSFLLSAFLSSLLAISFLWLITIWKPHMNLKKYAPLLVIAVHFFYLNWQPNEVIHSNPQLRENWKPDLFQSINQVSGEGRALDYVENTLVAPHTSSEKIATGLATLGEYFRLHVFPNELSFYYGYAKVKTENFSNWQVWLSLLIHLGMIVLAFWQLRIRPLLSIGVFWYIGSILLFSNWVELVAGMVGERLAFTASAGFCIMVGGILFAIKPKFSWKNRGVTEYITIAILLVFAGRTFVRNMDWKDATTLMSNDIQHLGNSAQANNLLALNLMKESTTNPMLGNHERLEMQTNAVLHFDKATQIWPYFFNAHFDKGRSAMMIGDYTKAKDGFETAIQLDSTYLDSYYNLLQVYELSGEGTSYLQIAKKLLYVSNTPSSYERIARGFFLINQPDSALIYLQNGLKVFPNDESLRFNVMELQKVSSN